MDFLETSQSSFTETEEANTLSPTYDSVFSPSRSSRSGGLSSGGQASSSSIQRSPSTRRRTARGEQVDEDLDDI